MMWQCLAGTTNLVQDLLFCFKVQHNCGLFALSVSEQWTCCIKPVCKTNLKGQRSFCRYVHFVVCLHVPSQARFFCYLSDTFDEYTDVLNWILLLAYSSFDTCTDVLECQTWLRLQILQKSDDLSFDSDFLAELSTKPFFLLCPCWFLGVGE